MKLRISISFVLDTATITTFFDKRNTAACTSIKPKMTIEKLTDGYKEK